MCVKYGNMCMFPFLGSGFIEDIIIFYLSF